MIIELSQNPNLVDKLKAQGKFDPEFIGKDQQKQLAEEAESEEEEEGETDNTGTVTIALGVVAAIGAVGFFAFRKMRQ